jgi:hypothetical protein
MHLPLLQCAVAIGCGHLLQWYVHDNAKSATTASRSCVCSHLCCGHVLCVSQDAHAWLRNYEGEPFDLIIMDIADPIEAGPG